MRKLALTLAVLTLVALPALAGEWHTGQNNLCADCHTMHNSMSHTWNNTGAVSVGTPVPDGNWVKAGTTGGGNFLLKADDPNALCLACHDNQTFAPDVLGANSAGGAINRAAGYLNADTDAVQHTGHTLHSMAQAPGGTWTGNATVGLECIHCHTQHGRGGVYRNLGPRSGATVPTYALNGRNPVDVTTAGYPTDLATAASTDGIDIFIDAAAYTPNTSNFAAFYETDNIKYLKRTTLVDGIENASGTQCAYCHGAFHGAPDSANIGGEVSGTSFDQFNRHPVGGIILGTLGGGHSNLARFQGGTTKVKVYADDQTNFTDAAPGCVSCHKAHGNGQPFGLIFAKRTEVAGSMTEEGTFAANPTPTGLETAAFQRALCGQCHVQGN